MKILDILQAPWALPESHLHEIRELYFAHTRREKFDFKAWEAATGRPAGELRTPYSVQNGVAVIPVQGVMVKAESAWNRLCGMTSSATLRADLQAAMDDNSVQSIVLWIDSPGGQVDGTQVLAQDIFAARGQKQIIAFADGTMASAAYWIGAAADQVYISSQTDMVGSIGVVAQHIDRSAAAGGTVTEITAGKYKRIASENGPLTEEGRESLQTQVDRIYSVFVEDIAKFRGVSVETVLANMADGRIFMGSDAIDAGLADGVSSLPELIAGLQDGRLPAPIGAGAALEPPTDSIGETMDINELKAKHSDLAQALIEEGKKAGAAAELARVAGCMEAALPGYEKLAREMALDGQSKPGDVAMAIIERQKTTLKTAQAQAEEGPEPVPATEDPEQREEQERQEEKQQEETPEARWAKDANLRAEFANNFNAFAAYEKAVARGTVRIQKGA